MMIFAPNVVALLVLRIRRGLAQLTSMVNTGDYFYHIEKKKRFWRCKLCCLNI